MAAFFQNLWDQISIYFHTIDWWRDLPDILLVALCLYFIIRLVRDSRAEQLLRGILVLMVLYGVAAFAQFNTLKFLLASVFDNGLLLLMVVFQPEVRRALEQAGNSRKGIARVFGGFKVENNANHIDQWNKAIVATVDA